MNTEILRVDPVLPEPTVIAKAADLLRAGRLVAFPTETVYGLGANALNSEAVRGIFAAKGRPASNPVIVHVAEPSQISNVAADWPATASKLAERFWPGPLTIVVPKKPGVPDEVTAGGPTVAVRCPNHPVARALIAAAGVPIAAPSANRSTELSPTRAEHVLKGLAGRIDMVLDGGPCPGGLESTVVDVTGPGVRLLRPGLISAPTLEEVVGPLASRVCERPEEIARSPGQMVKHYSPRTPLVLATSVPEAVSRVNRLVSRGNRVGLWMMEVLWGDETTGGVPNPGPGVVFVKQMPSEPEACAGVLYQTLHEFDAMGLDEIIIDMPPDTPEWAAVRDRLTRAAAGN